MTQKKIFRRRFYKELLTAFGIIWPIFSVILCIMVSLGLIVSYFEAWRPLEGVYFAFVTGLTVGYGDLAPTHPVSRVLAIGIGFTGVLLTALFAAISVRALEAALRGKFLAPPTIPERESR